jgi:hypothetical protein
VAIAESDEDPLTQTAAFRRFQEHIGERLVGPVDFKSMTIIGSYGGQER